MTNRDLEIIETLTCRARVMTFSQIAELWWEGESDPATVCLDTLVDRGAIELTNTYSRYVKKTECLLKWTPPDPRPNFEQVIDSHNRGTQTLTIAGDIYTATRFAANLFASEFTTFPSPEERPEHLRLSDAYVAFCSSRSTEASFWFNCRAGESDATKQHGPEVLVANPEGTAIRAVSVLSQSVQRLRSIQNYCEVKEIPYELW